MDDCKLYETSPHYCGYPVEIRPGKYKRVILSETFKNLQSQVHK